MTKFITIPTLMMMGFANIGCPKKVDLARVIEGTETTKATVWSAAKVAFEYRCRNGGDEKDNQALMAIAKTLDLLTAAENTAINLHNSDGAWIPEIPNLVAVANDAVALFNDYRLLSRSRGEPNQAKIKVPKVKNVTRSKSQIPLVPETNFEVEAQQLINGCGSG